MLGAAGRNFGAVLTGTLDAPRLTGTPERIERWRGAVALWRPTRPGRAAPPIPTVALAADRDQRGEREERARRHRAGRLTLLFLLTMLLAGMVLSNLVEEKANKIIEILAAAIPMDAVFLGKLFAMLAVSFVGIAVWGGARRC